MVSRQPCAHRGAVLRPCSPLGRFARWPGGERAISTNKPALPEFRIDATSSAASEPRRRRPLRAPRCWGDRYLDIVGRGRDASWVTPGAFAFSRRGDGPQASSECVTSKPLARKTILASKEAVVSRGDEGSDPFLVSDVVGLRAAVAVSAGQTRHRPKSPQATKLAVQAGARGS